MKIRERKEILFLIVALVLCLLLFLERLTGEIFHVILGIIFIGMMVVHTSRQLRKLKYQKLSVKLADWWMLVVLIVAFLSGMLLHPLHGIPAVLVLHKISSLLLIAGILVHNAI